MSALTKRQWIVIVLALLESFFLSGHYAMFMPFYPTEAAAKGNTATQIGAFFSIGAIVGLILAPFIGYLLTKQYSPKKMVISGLILSGFTLSLHGLYRDIINLNGVYFFGANFLTKLVHSVGPVMATTAIYPIVSVEAGEHRETFIPLIESCYNIGLMVWPSFGAILYDHLGYLIPFVITGMLALVMAVVLGLFLPPTELSKKPSDDSVKFSISKLDFTLAMIFLNITTCYLVIGFNDITLSTELMNFGLTHTQIGLAFTACTVCYGVFVTFVGSLSKNEKLRFMFQILGFILTIGGLALMGPADIILEGSVMTRLIGQGLIGTGLACLFGSSLVQGMSHLLDDLGLPDDVSTHGFFSGLLFSSLSFGYLIGQFGFAGLLYDYAGGYRGVVWLMIYCIGVLFIITLITMCIPRRKISGYTKIGEDSSGPLRSRGLSMITDCPLKELSIRGGYAPFGSQTSLSGGFVVRNNRDKISKIYYNSGFTMSV